MSTPDVDHVVEEAIEAEAHGGKHDPRIDKLYRQDVIVIYFFVVALWVVLWSVFFLVANPEITDDKLRWLLIGLGRLRLDLQQRRHDLQHAPAQARGRAVLLPGPLLAGREEASQGAGAPVSGSWRRQEVTDG